jgi:hypothetical protein
VNVLALVLVLAIPSSGALNVRASAAFAPCIAPVVESFNLRSGTRAMLHVGLPHPVGDADIVIGDDSEMTRVLEGGAAALATAVDLGPMAWVHVAPEGLAATAAGGPVAVLGGAAGREARALLWRSRAAMRVETDPEELRRADYALVPLSLAGAGARRPADLPPLRATAAGVTAARNGAAASRFLAFLRGGEARSAVDRCFGAAAVLPPAGAGPAGMDVYGRAVVDWWLPECSRTRNTGHNDPQESLGPPNVLNLGGGRFRGLISLGQGGYVTLELGEPATDGPGADIRVFQAVSNEPVTLYAAATAEGPFALVGLRRSCGVRPPSGGVFSNHCDFDLRDAGLSLARFVKVEDGEIYPCLAGGTLTEGADLDAVQALNR